MSQFASTKIRPCLSHDLAEIQSIYKLEVLEAAASFETFPPDLTEMTSRFRHLTEKGFPYLVCEVDHQVAGYAYAGPYRTRPAYQFSVENSVYVARWARRRGVGNSLLSNLISVCQAGPWQQMIAVIGDPKNNIGSVTLHTQAGFDHVGLLKSIGYKHDHWVDTAIMQRSLAQ